MNSIVVFAFIGVVLQFAAGSPCSQRTYLPKLNLLGPKVYNQPILGPGPIISAPAPIVAAPPCAAPVLGQTYIDNSISRSLAETLQFLVVSDLLESKLGPKVPLVTDIVVPAPGPCSCSSFLNVPPYMDYVSPCGTCGTTYLDSYPYGISETIVAPEYILPGSPCGSCIDPVLGSYLPSVYY